MQSETRAYIQLFIIVVQEDKLRVGPRNMLHHQVVAEVVMVKDWHREKILKYLKWAASKQIFFKTSNSRVLVSKDTKEECPGSRRL